MTGGIGIYGGRKHEETSKYPKKKLTVDQYPSTIQSGVEILKQSEMLRKEKPKKSAFSKSEYKEVKQQFDQKARERAKTHNFQLDLGTDDKVRSLHIGNDIALTINEPEKSSVDSYKKLTKTLDKGVKRNQEKLEKEGTLEKKDLFQSIATDMNDLISGKVKEENMPDLFAPMSPRTKSSAFDFSAVLFTEKVRETHGSLGQNLVSKSLESVNNKRGFEEVYVDKRSQYAPFSGEGGASVFKKRKTDE